MRQRLGFLAVCLAARLAGAAAPAELPERWREWLGHDVAAVISPAERESFLRLTDEAERERFVTAFWLNRDPTPGTRRNEYRDEIERRVSEADARFGRDTSRRGSLTDRGRIYVLLGEPQDRREFPSNAAIWPCEVWFYQSPKGLGLPAFLNLLFFRKHGVGEMRLYSPVGDGPEALVGGNAYTSRPRLLEMLKAVDVDLFRASLSVDPAGVNDADAGTVSLSSEIALSRIQSLPQRATDTRYLDKFLAPETEVKTEIAYAEFEITPYLLAARSASGVAWVHYQVLVPPEYLALDEGAGRYIARLELFATFRDPRGRTVRQVVEPVALDLPEAQLGLATSAPLGIDGRVALVPGTYRATFLVRNQRTGAFGTGESEVVVPGTGGERSGPRLGASFLAVHGEPVAGRAQPDTMPFELNGLRFFPLRDGLLRGQEKPWLVAQVLYPPAAPPGRLVKTLAVERDGKEVFGYMGFVEANPAFDGGAITLAEPLRLGDALPGRYQARLAITTASGQAIGQASFSFELGESEIRRPWVLTRSAELAGLHRELGRQFLLLGDRAGAVGEYRRQAEAEPGSRLEVAASLLDLDEPARAAELLEPLLGETPVTPMAHVYHGASLALLGRPAEAAVDYEKAVAALGPRPALLNALGEAYLRAGQKDKARASFERSLAADPNQPAVRQALQSLGG